MTAVDVFVGGLAVWRITHMLLWEEGPFKVFFRLRELFSVEHDYSGAPVSWATWFPANLFECAMCMSVWVTGLLAAVFYLVPFGTEIIYVISWASVAAGMTRWFYR